MAKVTFSKTQLITMGALVGVGLFNPFSTAVLHDWFQLVYLGVFALSTAWIVVYVLWTAFKPEPVNLKPKGKTRTQRYIETAV